MNDIIGRSDNEYEQSATSARVALRLAAALREAACVVSGREARRAGTRKPGASTERPAARGARINHVVSMPPSRAPHPGRTARGAATDRTCAPPIHK